MDLPPPDVRTRFVAPPNVPSPPSPSPRRRWSRRAAAVAVAGGVFAFDRSGVAVVVLLLVLVVPIERLVPRHRQPMRRPGLVTDIAYGVTGPALRVLTSAVGIAIGVASLAWLPGLLLRPLVLALPLPARVALGAVVLDALTYWLHRFSHEVAFLWRFHKIHHSSAQLDWVSGLRVHPLDGAFVAPPFVFLVAAGVPLKATGVLAVLQLVVGLFLHANVRWRLRPLQRFVATPEFHHWHHANEPDALNHNYATFLPIWDIVFGTWFMPADRRPQRYGIDEAMPTGFVAQLRRPWQGLPRPGRLVVDAVRHPFRQARVTRAALRRGATQVMASIRRPTRSLHS
jgi:sterol desaturase/sphingolipid hydroxylase (fatty acid hydroxylase superfamily)